MADSVAASVYPEINFGGYSRVDGSVEFYSRVQALLTPDATVLDVGCGRGRHAEDSCRFRQELSDFRGQGRRVVGIDVSDAGSANPLINEFRKIDDVDHWPVESGSIDLAIANSVVEHVERPQQFFAEAWRVLRPGGFLCFRTYNKWGYVGICARIVPNSMHAKVTGYVQRDRKEHDVFPTLYRCNTPGKVRRALRSQGFRYFVYTIEAEPSYLRFSPLLYRIGATVHTLIPPAFRWVILAYGQKPTEASGARSTP